MAVLKNASLKSYSYYNTGGTCDELYLPESIEEACQSFQKIHASGKKFFILGAGSNSLVMDAHFSGAVISMTKLNHIQLEKNGVINCQAGVNNHDFVKFTADQQLSGIEWLSGLPGQIGGTVRMNARCYGGEVSQVVVAVTTVDKFGQLKEYTGLEVFRGYKDTLMMDNGELVVSARFILNPDKAVNHTLIESCYEDRKNKGQYSLPSCGCVFKNNYNVGRSSGVLLDEAGAKLLHLGGAKVSPHHANFIFNDGASAEEILSLSLKMRDIVWQKHKIWLEYEMEILGEIPESFQKELAKTP